jgi:putative phosphoesterase
VTRIALVSDTHLPRFGQHLPAALLDALADLRPDLIGHLGDHIAGFVVDQLSAFAPVEAVAGNNDGPDLVERFGVKRIVAADGVRLGLTHGHVGRGATTPDRAAATFASDDVDVVAFGHSHVPLVEPRGSRLLVNPGSPTDRRRQPAPTFAVLEVAAGSPPVARIVALPVTQRGRLRGGSDG